MLNLAEYRQRPALLADWLPWAGLIAPGVVLNKDGSFQRTARFRGPDLDSATQGELIATSARLNNALRRLGLQSQHRLSLSLASSCCTESPKNLSFPRNRPFSGLAVPGMAFALRHSSVCFLY